MPTLIYNQNSFVRWDKTECDLYTITNIVNYSAVDVTITDLTGDYTESFTLEIGGSNSITLPGDGVFKICAIAKELLPDNQYTLQNFTFKASVVNIGAMAAAGESRILQVSMTTGGIIYNSTANGGPDPDNNWTTPPTSYQSVITVIQAWLDANGGGEVRIIAPGDQPYTWLPIDPDDYQLVIIALGGDSISQVITAQSAEISPVYHDGDVDCLNTWQGQLPESGVVVSVLFNDEEVLSQPWDTTTEEGIAGFISDIQAWLAVNGGGQVLPDGQEFIVVFEQCLQSQVITMGNLVPSVEECDYIYELCDTFACITRLVNKWLCKDPCPKPNCQEDTLDYEEARRRAIDLSTLFFHALMPLVSVDRLWYLGNWDVNEDRTCNVNNIIELFSKLRAYVKQCGFDCCNPCGDCGGCGDCSGCGGGGYNNTSPNPCNCS